MTSHRRLSQRVPESDIRKITNEAARRMRKGERVAPEEPLEGGDAGGHHGEPYQ